MRATSGRHISRTNVVFDSDEDTSKGTHFFIPFYLVVNILRLFQDLVRVGDVKETVDMGLRLFETVHVGMGQFHSTEVTVEKRVTNGEDL